MMSVAFQLIAGTNSGISNCPRLRCCLCTPKNQRCEPFINGDILMNHGSVVDDDLDGPVAMCSNGSGLSLFGRRSYWFMVIKMARNGLVVAGTGPTMMIKNTI